VSWVLLVVSLLQKNQPNKNQNSMDQYMSQLRRRRINAEVVDIFKEKANVNIHNLPFLESPNDNPCEIEYKQGVCI